MNKKQENHSGKKKNKEKPKIYFAKEPKSQTKILMKQDSSDAKNND